MAPEKTFLELVEFHERKWGTEQYSGRPTLQELLNSPIVAMWRVGKRFMLSVHHKADDLNDLVMSLVMGTVENPDRRTLYKIYYLREPIDFRIKIVSHRPDDLAALEQKLTKTTDEQKNEPDSISESNGIKPWYYPEQPTIVDTNPQRAIREVPPNTPHYIPQVVERNGKKSTLKPVKQLPVLPGRNDPHLPGRKVRIVHTRLGKSSNEK